jgi:sporulation protein YlmC with PRC-barrel domain
MKRTVLSVAALAAIALTVPAIAQAPKPATPAASASTTKVPSGVFFKRQAEGQYLIRDRLIGAKVTNKDGTIIGDIEDVIISSQTQAIEGIVMGVGGFLGAGEKKVGVRLSALQFSTKDGKTTISLPQATKEVLAALEPYQRAQPRKSLVERTREKAKELTDKIKDGGALDKAKEVGQSAIEKGKELGAQAAEKGKQVIDAAKERTGIGQPAPTNPTAPTAPKQ